MPPSFYSPPPERRDDLLRAYLRFLHDRNGATDTAADFPKRESWLAQANGSDVRNPAAIDPALFEASFAFFKREAAEVPALTTLLAFVKMNAGEAYGVEAISKARHGQPAGSDLFDQVERVLAKEETYHTRILLGATRQFGVPEPKSAYRPPLAVKALIGALVHAPKSLFHPVLLGAEIGGLYSFNWMLGRVREVFRDAPALRDLMEARMIEIIVDEIGHVAFNRMAVGAAGIKAAALLAPQVAHHAAGATPELKALGWSRETAAEAERFDLMSLPEEARARAFFV